MWERRKNNPPKEAGGHKAARSTTMDEDRRLTAFKDTVLIHMDSAYTFARYLSRRDDLADDIVQDAFLRAFQSFDRYRGENAKAWLLTIVRNCFLTLHARRKLREDLSTDGLPPHIEYDPADEQETPETILIANQESAQARQMLETVPSPFREILILRDIEDLSYHEIAEVLSVPIGTVMSRLARARKLFALAWKELASEAEKIR